MSRLKCDNYVEVEKDSVESALTILKVSCNSNPCGTDQKKVTINHLNYYHMILNPPTVVRLIVIEIVEGHGIIETATLTVPLTEETTPLTIIVIQVRIGIQIKDMVTELV